MSDMVERVAQAIYAERYLVEIAFGAMPAWEDVQGSDRTGTFDEARAAIEAMREPTEAMVTFAERKIDEPSYMVTRGYIDRDDITRGYQAMVDAALKGEAE